jgi:hypothetical protein
MILSLDAGISFQPDHFFLLLDLSDVTTISWLYISMDDFEIVSFASHPSL